MQISQEHLPEGDIAFPLPKASSGKCQNPVISGFLQPSVPCLLFCSRSSQIYHRVVAGPGVKNQLHSWKTRLLSQLFNVPDRSAIHNIETGTIRLPSHEAHIMTPKEQLAYSRIPGQAYSHFKVPSPHLNLWLKEENALYSWPLHPFVMPFTDASNEGWGTHLGDCTTKVIWSLPESKLHINFLELPFKGTDC